MPLGLAFRISTIIHQTSQLRLVFLRFDENSFSDLQYSPRPSSQPVDSVDFKGFKQEAVEEVMHMGYRRLKLRELSR